MGSICNTAVVLLPSLLVTFCRRWLQGGRAQMRRMWHQARLSIGFHSCGVMRAVAICAFAFYAVWNVFWLAGGHLPPPMLGYFTGLPCPTTGCVRSLSSLWHGDFVECLLWNPVCLLYIGLLVLSAWLLIRSYLIRRVLVLPSWVGFLWLASLGTGWASKFLLGTSYW